MPRHSAENTSGTSIFDSALTWIKRRPSARSRTKPSSREKLEVFDLAQYQPLLLARATRLTRDLPPRVSPEDLVQETLLEAHQTLHHFHGQTEAEMIMWLSRILSNNIADTFRSLRRKKRDIARERPLADQAGTSFRTNDRLVSSVQTPSYFARSAEDEAELAAAIQQLPPAQQDAIVMHHLQGHPLSKVAECLGRSRSAVAGLVFRGLKTLRERLVDAGT